MIKKMLVTWTVIGMALLVGVNLVDICTGEITDEDVMNEYIREHYGEECYGALYDCDEDEDIEFVVFKNGDARWSASIDREYFTHKYND